MPDFPFPVFNSAVLQNAAVATGIGAPLDVSRCGTAVLHTFGTFVGTVTYEGSVDGANWFTLTGYTIGTSTGVTTATAAAAARFNVAALAMIRARISAYTSGAITVKGNATSEPAAFAATSN